MLHVLRTGHHATEMTTIFWLHLFIRAAAGRKESTRAAESAQRTHSSRARWEENRVGQATTNSMAERTATKTMCANVCFTRARMAHTDCDVQ